MAVKILYIVSAAGRSGTTLLARVLGEIEGCVNVGEAGRLIRGEIPDDPCGCGKLLESCPFWNQMEETISGAAREFPKRWVRTRFLLREFLLSRFRPFSVKQRQFAEALICVYDQIAQRFGATMIVECIDGPAYLDLLTKSRNNEFYLIHLVRDPRQVALSWSKPKGLLPTYSAVRVCALWLAHNVLFEWLGRRARGYWRIRYEDLVQRPGETVEWVTNRILGKSLSPVDERGRVHLHPQHHVAGNPDKLVSGKLVIRPHTAIRLPFSLRFLGLLLTFPLLRRYGYF